MLVLRVEFPRLMGAKKTKELFGVLHVKGTGYHVCDFEDNGFLKSDASDDANIQGFWLIPYATVRLEVTDNQDGTFKCLLLTSAETTPGGSRLQLDLPVSWVDRDVVPDP